METKNHILAKQNADYTPKNTSRQVILETGGASGQDNGKVHN